MMNNNWTREESILALAMYLIPNLRKGEFQD